MGSISDYIEKEILDHILGTGAKNFTPAGTLYIGLSSTDPLDAQSGITEPVGNGYGRIAITFGNAATRKSENDGTLTFPQATGAGWGALDYWFVCNHQTNTTFGTDVQVYAHGTLAAQKTVNAGNTPSMAIGEVDVIVDAGGVPDDKAHIILNFLFNGGALVSPTNLYVALATAALTAGSTGTSLVDMTMTGYARVNYNSWDDAVGESPASVDNNGLIDFGTFTAGGPETIESVAICAALTDGELWFYDNTISQAVADNDSVNFQAGQLAITAA